MKQGFFEAVGGSSLNLRLAYGSDRRWEKALAFFVPQFHL